MPYHVTPARNLPEIRTRGLEPGIGPRALDYGEATPAVFLFRTIEDLQAGLDGWICEAFDEDDGLACLLVEDGSDLICNGSGFELECHGAISPARLSVLCVDLLSLDRIPDTCPVPIGEWITREGKSSDVQDPEGAPAPSP